MHETLRAAVKRRAGIGASTSTFDTDINGLIDAALSDLVSGGMADTLDWTDPLVQTAIITYCLANAWWMDVAERQSYEKTYALQAAKLGLIRTMT